MYATVRDLFYNTEIAELVFSNFSNSDTRDNSRTALLALTQRQQQLVHDRNSPSRFRLLTSLRSILFKFLFTYYCSYYRSLTKADSPKGKSVKLAQLIKFIHVSVIPEINSFEKSNFPETIPIFVYRCCIRALRN